MRTAARHTLARVIFAALAVLLLTMAPVPATAQDAPDEPSDAAADDAAVGEELGAIDAIVVNARRRDESIQRAPVAIMAFDEETLVDASAATITDLGALTPGLFVEGTGSGGGGTLSMRSPP